MSGIFEFNPLSGNFEMQPDALISKEGTAGDKLTLTSTGSYITLTPSLDIMEINKLTESGINDYSTNVYMDASAGPFIWITAEHAVGTVRNYGRLMLNGDSGAPVSTLRTLSNTEIYDLRIGQTAAAGALSSNEKIAARKSNNQTVWSVDLDSNTFQYSDIHVISDTKGIMLGVGGGGGSGGDVRIYYDGSDTQFVNLIGTGDYYFDQDVFTGASGSSSATLSTVRSDTDDPIFALQANDSTATEWRTYLDNDNSDTLTYDYGGTNYMNLLITGDLQLSTDSVGLVLGAGNDVRVSYDGTDTIFDNLVGTGTFNFDNTLRPVTAEGADIGESGAEFSKFLFKDTDETVTPFVQGTLTRNITETAAFGGANNTGLFIDMDHTFNNGAGLWIAPTNIGINVDIDVVETAASVTFTPLAQILKGTVDFSSGLAATPTDAKGNGVIYVSTDHNEASQGLFANTGTYQFDVTTSNAAATGIMSTISTGSSQGVAIRGDATGSSATVYGGIFDAGAPTGIPVGLRVICSPNSTNTRSVALQVSGFAGNPGTGNLASVDKGMAIVSEYGHILYSFGSQAVTAASLVDMSQVTTSRCDFNTRYGEFLVQNTIEAQGGLFADGAFAFQRISKSADYDVSEKVQLASVADAGSGQVDFTTSTVHGLSDYDIFTVYGTTNYDGDYFIAGGGVRSTTVVRVTKTYTAESFGAGASLFNSQRDALLALDTSGGAVTATLPPAAEVATGRVFMFGVEGDASTNNGTVDVHNSGTINGATSYVMDTDEPFFTVYNTGSEYKIMSAYGKFPDPQTFTDDVTLDGGIYTPVTSIDDTDSPYTVLATDSVIIADATSGAITVNLPAVSGTDGRTIRVKKIDSSANAVTLDGNSSETIDDATTRVLSSQYDSITIVSDDSEWWIV